MDQALVARVQGGDQRAFESLVTTDHSRPYRVACGILRDRHLAEDATRQALGAWQVRPIVGFTLPDGTYPTWTGILDGEGDYEGLTAIFEVVEGATAYRLRGIVIDGEVPPPPETMLADHLDVGHAQRDTSG